MARGFGFSPPAYTPGPTALVPASGAGILQGGDAVAGAGVTDWFLGSKAQASGKLAPWLTPCILNSNSAYMASGGIVGGIVPTASGVANPPSGAPYELFCPPYSNDVWGSGFRGPARNIYDASNPWYMAYNGFDWYLYRPDGSRQAFAAQMQVAFNTSWVTNQSGSCIVGLGAIDVFGNYYSATLFGVNISNANFPAANTWTTGANQSDYVPYWFPITGSPSTSGQHYPVVEVFAVAGIENNQAGQASPGQSGFMDSVVIGPYNPTGGVVYVWGAQVLTTSRGIVSVPAAQFSPTYPTAPASGTLYETDLIWIDPTSGTYQYQSGQATSVAGNALPAGMAKPDGIPCWQVNLSITSAGSTTLSLTDVRNLLGSVP